MNPRFNSPITIAKRCKSIGRPQRDCILEWARLNPEKISSFLNRLSADPKRQISFRGLYDSLCFLYLRLINEEARTVELMELQVKHRVELLLAEERICLEQHEKELAVRKSRVLYLESVSGDSEFAERTQWRSKLPPLPKWPSWRKSNKKRPRVTSGDGPEPGATAALIRESFPNQKGVVVSETAPMPEGLLDISLEEVVFAVEWKPTVKEILPDNASPVVDKSVEDIVEPVLDVEPEKKKPLQLPDPDV